MENIEEIIMGIASINQDIHEIMEGWEEIPVTYEHDGFSAQVKFLGMCIWDTEMDDREYIDADNLESVEDYCRREINKRIQRLTTLKLPNS